MASYEDLKAIEASDPDGGEFEPTEAAYAAHEKWAVAAFGRETWNTYRQGGWGDGYAHHSENGYDEYL